MKGEVGVGRVGEDGDEVGRGEEWGGGGGSGEAGVVQRRALN